MPLFHGQRVRFPIHLPTTQHNAKPQKACKPYRFDNEQRLPRVPFRSQSHPKSGLKPYWEQRPQSYEISASSEECFQRVRKICTYLLASPLTSCFEQSTAAFPISFPAPTSIPLYLSALLDNRLLPLFYPPPPFLQNCRQ